MNKTRTLKNCRRAVSYAISAVIIAGVTIVLVVVALTYAYQTIEQQQGASEYKVVKNSFLALNDALASVAWKSGSSRSIRFSVNQGELWLLKNDYPITVNVTINSNPVGTPFQIRSGVIRYSIGSKYVNFGENYTEYFIGDNITVTNSSTIGFGRACIQGVGGHTNIIFYPAVRAMKTSVIQVKEGGELHNVTYIDVWLIKLDMKSTSIFRGEFDLKIQCMNITTPQTFNSAVSEGDICTINVQIGDMESTVNIPINHNGKAVINFIVSTVRIEI